MSPLARLAVSATILALALAAPARARAQGTDEQLRQAVALYQDLQVERSLAFLRKVVSPASPFVVTPEQRVEAYKYLGGSFVIIGQRDSAIVYFTAALERDPFVELEPQVFTPRERAAFAEAKRRIFALGVRRPALARIDPASERVTFVLVTSHAADVQVDLRNPDGTAVASLWRGEADGTREVPWSGVGAGGRLVPAGRYELAVSGRSRVGGRADSTRVFLDVRHDHPALEDTLPALRPDELLPERHPEGAGARDLLKGLGVAGAALLVRTLLPSGTLGGDEDALAMGAAAAGGVTGVAAFLYRRGHAEIPANVAANRRLLADRAARNAQIVARNDARLAQTRLVIAPAGGLVQ